MAARQHGAKALLVVTGPRSPNAGQTVPMTFDTALAGRAFRRPASAARSPRRSSPARRKTLATCRRSSTAAIRTSPASRCRRHVDADDEAWCARSGRRATSSRICRRLAASPASRSRGSSSARTTTTSGAATHGNSLASARTRPASLTTAPTTTPRARRGACHRRALAQPADATRNLLVALWSAEEIGLVGRARSSQAPPVPLDQVAAYLNFDMVGRMQDNKLVAQATGTSPVVGVASSSARTSRPASI